MPRILPGVIAMAIIVVASNILVQYQLGNWLTWGALTYPIAFLVTDIMNRVYGTQAARRVVLAGFVTGLLCSLVAAGFDKTTLRIAIASGAAFLSAQLMDIAVFNQLRKYNWWLPPLAASLVGSVLDTAVFFSIAFAAMQAECGVDAEQVVRLVELSEQVERHPGISEDAKAVVQEFLHTDCRASNYCFNKLHY